MFRSNHLGLFTQIYPRNMVWMTLLKYRSILLKGSSGDVVCLQIFSEVIVVLCSLSAIKDLLEKRGETYSDRPPLPIFQMCA